MPGLDWLTARPIAHRGLHDAARGIVENTASAFAAAIANGYGIETDLQRSGDGEAMVHHDPELGRLTDGSGRLDRLSAEALRRVPFRNSTDRMMSLGELCDLVAGRVPLLLEIKSRFDGDTRLAAHVASVLQGYRGPVAAMSFDPELVTALRRLAPGLPRGVVAQQGDLGEDNVSFSSWRRISMAYLLHLPRSRPHFVAYSVRDLPALSPWLARHVLGLPLLTWTVRTASDRIRARWAQQIIFEGFRPDPPEAPGQSPAAGSADV